MLTCRRPRRRVKHSYQSDHPLNYNALLKATEMDKQKVEGFRLSQQQEQLWQLRQEQTGGMERFQSSCRVRIKGALDGGRLRRAAAEVVRRHEILRTTYEYLPAMRLPVQVVNEEEAAGKFIAWQEHELSEKEAAERERELESLRKEQQEEGYDYEHGPLLRLSLVRLKEAEHELLLSLPALCADARSVRNLVAELRRCYEAITQGKQLHDEPLQYADFAEIQHELLESDDTEAGRAYWNKQRVGVGAGTRLTHLECIAGPSAKGVEFTPRSLPLEYDAATVKRLQQVVREQQCTMSDLLLSCWLVMLRLVTGQRALLVGVQCEGRRYERLQEAIGLFARQLPVQLECSGEEQFWELLRQVREQREELERWQEYYGGDEAEGGEGGYWPVSFAYEERPGEEALGWEVQTAVCWAERFGVQLRSQAEGARLSSALDYDGAVYERAEVARLGQQFQRVVRSVVSGAPGRVRELQVVSEAERGRLREWNATAVSYAGEDLCLHELVEAQVARTAAAIAVVGEPEQLSYGELNERANQLAHYLRRAGVGALRRSLYSRIRLRVADQRDVVDGMPRRWRTGGRRPGSATRRRVHSPSCAISSSVVSVTVVRGSTKPSTPRRRRTNSSRCAKSRGGGPAARRSRDSPPPKPRHRPSPPRPSPVHAGSAPGYDGIDCPRAPAVAADAGEVTRWPGILTCVAEGPQSTLGQSDLGDSRDATPSTSSSSAAAAAVTRPRSAPRSSACRSR